MMFKIMGWYKNSKPFQYETKSAIDAENLHEILAQNENVKTVYIRAYKLVNYKSPTLYKEVPFDQSCQNTSREDA